jgi:hypothetical protein
MKYIPTWTDTLSPVILQVLQGIEIALIPSRLSHVFKVLQIIVCCDLA